MVLSASSGPAGAAAQHSGTACLACEGTEAPRLGQNSQHCAAAASLSLASLTANLVSPAISYHVRSLQMQKRCHANQNSVHAYRNNWALQL